MAYVSATQCTDGLEDIVTALEYLGEPIAIVRAYPDELHTEEEIRDALLDLDLNPTRTFIEIYMRGTQGISNSVGQHEIRRDHFLTLDAYSVWERGRERLDYVSDLFETLHQELLQYGNIRAGTGQPGTMLLPWQMAFDPRQTRMRGEVKCFFAQYTAQLRNQPEETAA